ncbi:type IV pilus assembly protein PilM [Patescibacteria group bacterium]|nr:type IV pilus assembly protein PilM [Patescibacteria group bacterium]
MANFFKKLFNKKVTNVVGIDIGSSSVKVVQLSIKNGKAILDTYGELALGPYAGTEIGRATNLPPEKLAEALKDVLRESKVTTTSAGLAIPFGSSLISAIEMPALEDAKLAQMIPLEARKYIPVPITEVMLDWMIIPKDVDKSVDFGDKEQVKQGEKIDVLLVAIHNDMLARFQSIVSQAALNASFFEIEIFSTIRSSVEQDAVTQMIVDLGAASTKVYIVERGIVRTSHIINRGSQDITMALSKSLGMTVQEAEIMKRDLHRVPDTQRKTVDDIMGLTLEYIFSDAHRVMLAYQKKYNKDVSRVVMVGGGARVDHINEIAEKYFQTSIVLGNPFGKTESPAFLEQVLKKTGPEFAVAVGIALRKLQELG